MRRAAIKSMHGKLVLNETAKGVSAGEVIAAADARLKIDAGLRSSVPSPRKTKVGTKAS